MEIEEGKLYKYLKEPESIAFIHGEINRIPTYEVNTVIFTVEVQEDGVWVFDILREVVQYRKVILKESLVPLTNPNAFINGGNHLLALKYIKEVEFVEYKKRVHGDI